MAGRIPQNFIDELITRTDIVDVIDSRVPLKKKGRDYMACCPFHGEKTPSFSVSQEKQFYYCFGCGAHGTALGFLMDYEHLDFVTAVEELAARANMQVPREEGQSNAPDYTPLYQTMQKAEQFFKQQLRQHPQAERAVEYLKGRGLTGEIAEAYGMGFAPPGWDNLLRALGADGTNVDNLIKTGLVVDRENKRYDRFRDRIMFPIHDHRGRVVAFGGRILQQDKNNAKYLNSPETPIFHKSQTLYGLYQARQHLRDIERLLVVEGYMDVVALAQFGIRYAVATLGTATTREHLDILYRTTEELVFCFDGDRAGRQAADRAMQNLLAVMHEGRQARFLFLPEGEDPDSLIRKEGLEAFIDRIGSAIPFSTFFFDYLRDGVDTSSEDGRARLVALAKPLLAKMPSGVFRDMLEEKLANQAATDVQRLRERLHEEPVKQQEPVKQARRSRAAAAKQSPSLVRRAIHCLLLQPALAQQVEGLNQLHGLTQPGAELLYEMLEFLSDKPHLNTAAVLEHWRDRQEGRHLQKLAQNEDLIEATGLNAEFVDCVQQLIQQRQHQDQDARLTFLSNKPFTDLTDDEKNELKEIHRLKAKEKSNITES